MPSTWSDLVRRAEARPDRNSNAVLHKDLDAIAATTARLLDASQALIHVGPQRSPVLVGQATTEPRSVQAAACAPFHARILASNEPLMIAEPSPPKADAACLGDEPDWRFVAGLPLRGANGVAVGSICAFAPRPRDGLDPRQWQDFATMAMAAMACLERWRGLFADADGPAVDNPERAEQERIDQERMDRQFATLADAMPQLVWSTPTNGLSDFFSKQWCDYTGSPASASFGTGWLDFLHPDDVALAQAAWSRAVATGEPYTVEFRLRGADGAYRWMLTRGLPVTDEAGTITRWIGTCTDIDERVRTGDLLETLSRELSHRLKNLFAVVQSLIAMALRKHPDMADVSQSLQMRMVALGRAHDLVRPRIAEGEILRAQTTLGELVRILTLPYVQEDPTRLTISGEDAVVHEAASTPLALFFHEMAINSARFGALSSAQGRLTVRFAVADQVTIEWKEQGGPAIAAPPRPAFGLSLTQLTIERQLGGKLTLDWQSDGLHARAQFPREQLTA